MGNRKKNQDSVKDPAQRKTASSKPARRPNAFDYAEEVGEMVDATRSKNNLSKSLPTKLPATPAVPLRDIYDGALQCQIPQRFLSASSFPHLSIPEHQEVFIDPQLGESFTIELNSYQNVPDSSAVHHHLKDLARAAGDFEASGVDPLTTKSWPVPHTDLPHFSRNTFAAAVDGTHLINRMSEYSAPKVRVRMAVIRLKDVATDMLVIFSCAAGSESSPQPLAPATEEAFSNVLKTLEVTDRSLFG